MDPLKSNNAAAAGNVQEPIIPRRSFSVEFFVGLFTLISLACLGYLAIGLGKLDIFPSDEYFMNAEFDNISGLQAGASVEVGGVKVGDVVKIWLEDPVAVVRMKIDNSLKIKEDDIASIRTKGIIGDRYVKISRGSSDKYLKEEGRMTETESIIDIEDVIGKIVHNLGSSGDNEKGKE